MTEKPEHNPFDWYATFQDLRLGEVSLQEWLAYWREHSRPMN